MCVPLQLFGLPAKFITASGTGGGVIQGTSSEAVLVALLAARARALKGRPPADALRLVAYASDQVNRPWRPCVYRSVPLSTCFFVLIVAGSPCLVDRITCTAR